MKARVGADEVDMALLFAVEANGKATIRELAANVGLGTTPTFMRLRRLERSGYIMGYHAAIDWGALDWGEEQPNGKVLPFKQYQMESQKTKKSGSACVVEFPVNRGAGDLVIREVNGSRTNMTVPISREVLLFMLLHEYKRICQNHNDGGWPDLVRECEKMVSALVEEANLLLETH